MWVSPETAGQCVFQGATLLEVPPAAFPLQVLMMVTLSSQAYKDPDLADPKQTSEATQIPHEQEASPAHLTPKPPTSFREE